MPALSRLERSTRGDEVGGDATLELGALGDRIEAAGPVSLIDADRNAR